MNQCKMMLGLVFCWSATAGFDRKCSCLMFLFKAGPELGYLGSLGRKVENAKQGQNAAFGSVLFSAICLIVFDAASLGAENGEEMLG